MFTSAVFTVAAPHARFWRDWRVAFAEICPRIPAMLAALTKGFCSEAQSAWWLPPSETVACVRAKDMAMKGFLYAVSTIILSSGFGDWLAQSAPPKRIRKLLDALGDYDWLDAAWSVGIVVVAYVAGRIGARLVFRSVKHWASRTTSVADDSIAEHLPEPLAVLLPALAVRVVLPLLVLPAGLRAVFAHAVLIVVIVAVGWMVFRAVRVVEDVVSQRYDVQAADNLQARAVYTQLRGFRNIAGFLVIFVTLAFALMTFDKVRSIGAGLLASAGVAGIVLGFAAQRTLATLLAGIQIAITQPIRVDDVVIVEGEWGRIEEITLTYVVVRIWDLRRLIVPVGYFLDKPFENWTRVSADLLGTVELHLDYSVPVGELRKELKRVVEGSPLWNGEVCVVQVTDTSERTMLVRLLVSAKDSSDAWDLRCEARERLIAFVRDRYPHALPRLRAEVGETQHVAERSP